MSRFGGLPEERPSVFKTRSKLGTHLSTQCSGDERQSRPCAARHILESDEWGCKQLIHLGSRLQSVEACPTDAHLEQRTSLAGLALDSATSSGLGRAPALQCRTPSRQHLELQDRRDYTPADTAARTCWLGRPGLLYYLAD
ncbi:hypothetical protein TNCV_4127851 [Trichonephila clavipes]|uniref:Uncharacterized protein n=1 Tax=Trichonephila clavipes TaxID=2585209 RepID=A0A8X6T5Y2_TRICX|nr:hypothetical protein TNCV_4127851 [Trichonephila clavipes]